MIQTWWSRRKIETLANDLVHRLLERKLKTVHTCWKWPWWTEIEPAFWKTDPALERTLWILLIVRHQQPRNHRNLLLSHQNRKILLQMLRKQGTSYPRNLYQSLLAPFPWARPNPVGKICFSAMEYLHLAYGLHNLCKSYFVSRIFVFKTHKSMMQTKENIFISIVYILK